VQRLPNILEKIQNLSTKLWLTHFRVKNSTILRPNFGLQLSPL